MSKKNGVLTEIERFDAAFANMMADYPGEAPSPTLLNDEVWWLRGTGKNPGRWHRPNSLNGRLSKRRIELLKQHGFVKNEKTGKWQKA